MGVLTPSNPCSHLTSPTPWIFVTTYKKSPSCSLFHRNAGGSVNSRKGLAPPLGTRRFRVSAEFWGSRSTARQCKGLARGSLGWEGKKRGKKRHWELKKAQTCQTPTFVLRPNFQNVQNQPIISILYLWKGLPNAGNHLPRGLCWDSPGGDSKSHLSHQSQGLIFLFFSVFPIFFAFFSLFLLVQGVGLRCPQSTTMPERGKFQQL